MDAYIKQETVGADEATLPERNGCREVISLSSSSGSVFSSDGSDVEVNPKKQRIEAVLPVGFLDPIRPAGFMKRTGSRSGSLNGSSGDESLVRVKQENVIEKENYVLKEVVAANPVTAVVPITVVAVMPSCKQFWKAGDYEGCGNGANLYDGAYNFLPFDSCLLFLDHCLLFL